MRSEQKKYRKVFVGTNLPILLSHALSDSWNTAGPGESVFLSHAARLRQ